MATESLLSRWLTARRRASSDWRGNGQRFELAVQFFPEPVDAVELSFGFGILDARGARAALGGRRLRR